MRSIPCNLVVACLLAVGGVDSFAPSTMPLSFGSGSPTSSTTSLFVLDPAEMSGARTAFFLWFFGSSGGLGVALSAFPKLVSNFLEIRKLKGIGPTKDGERIGLSFLTGYPEDLYASDILNIANFPQSTEEIVKQYPIPNDFLSSRGYLTYAAFQQAHAAQGQTNPLAVRAVFDAFSTSDTVNPIVAQNKLDQLKKNPASIQTDLLKNKLSCYGAVLTLLFLLGLAELIAAGHAWQGWFPEWPGGVDFPTRLLEPNAGLQDIPKYWVFDVPEES